MSDHTNTAQSYADLANPIMPTRFPWLQRLIGKVAQVFIRNQAKFNQELLQIVRTHAEALATMDQGIGSGFERVMVRCAEQMHDILGQFRTELTDMQLEAADTKTQIAMLLNDLQHSENDKRDLRRLLLTAQAQLVQVDLFLKAYKKSADPSLQAEAIDSIPSNIEALYPAFENFHRGSFIQIKQDLNRYVDFFRNVPGNRPVLDLGCGRGELLELLKEAGIEAYGIDPLEANVDACRARGLKVDKADALTHLSHLEAGSLGGAAAIHLVEHLHPDALLHLLSMLSVALAPEGRLVIETPDPSTLIVGSSSFYLDPTHIRPVHPDFLTFALEAKGFTDLERLHLHPGMAELSTGNVALDRLMRQIYGAQDYAIKAKRA